MDFIRTIVDSDILMNIIEIPESLKHRKVEILVLPYENTDINKSSKQKFKRAKGLLEKYKNVELQNQESNAWGKAMADKHENS